MNDDVKAAIERFHTWEFDGLDARDHATLLAHIDGEPARIAAALRDMVAERDDERDQRIVAEVDRDRAHGAREVLGKLLVERDALRAQVTAARAECGRIIDGMYSADSLYAAANVLRAMDGAKP